ncbi:hypothetical protein SETIT_1G082700v2 [Setaria italica]|uniref:Uncharacterized protein n=1 Tax=Setaria italica TaxID=4555 RepID=A0A368PI27_SETIT|nr:hypothetical protein SETIT_1G082700v2 [Setaria italica]
MSPECRAEVPVKVRRAPKAFQDSRQNSTLPLAMAMMTTIGEPR